MISVSTGLLALIVMALLIGFIVYQAVRLGAGSRTNSVYLVLGEDGQPREIWDTREGAEKSIVRCADVLSGTYRVEAWHVHDSRIANHWEKV